MPIKISDLAEYASVTQSTYIPIVDLSVTPTVNKKIQVQNIKYFFGPNSSSYVSTMPGFFYFGDNSDGIGNFTSSVQITQSFSSSLDGPPIIKNFSSLRISQSLVVTPTNRCDGMMIFVDGDCIISGTISMTARGASGSAQDASFFPINPPYLGYYWSPLVFPSSRYQSVVSASGALGAPSSAINTSGSNGFDGLIGQSGGGGSGGSSVTLVGAPGGRGISFSGGAGGGGRGSTAPLTGSSVGGAGGNGGVGGGGGAGNPPGTGSVASASGSVGTGGLLVLIVKGNLMFGPSGSIQSNGSNGGNASSASCSGGGGSGGGVVYVYYGKQLITSSTFLPVFANGGVGGLGSGSGHRGGSGGSGSVVVANLYQTFPISY